MVLGVNKEKWIHPEETIMSGKVTYHVKFIGVTEVDDVRGMDVVRQAMQKLKFGRHIKRSEGSKPPKVDLNINVNGLQIVDQRTKSTIHDIPLQRVSFCADDKQDKRLFSFIAKQTDGKQFCYGLDSQHEANSITLTIGQAFELAYEKFLKSDKAVTSKRVLELSRRIESLEKENTSLKQRIQELESSQLHPVLPVTRPSQSCCNSLLMSSAATLDPTPLRPHFDSADQLLLDTSSASHSLSNQMYLKSKLASQQSARAKNDHVTKLANLDQTIASVEKARTSLNNLKEYVRKKKLQKLRRSFSCSQPTLSTLPIERSTLPMVMNKKLPETCTDVLTPSKILSLPSSGSNFHQLAGSDCKDCSFPSTVKLTTAVKGDLKTEESPNQSVELTSHRLLSERSLPLLPTNNLPETEIGDLVDIRVINNPYENCDPVPKMNEDVPPPIPPKPPSMMESTPQRIHSESFYSASGSDLSSLDSMSGHSFSLWPITDFYTNRCDSKTTSSSTSHASPSKDHLSSTLQRFAGEGGYMELRAVKDISVDAADKTHMDSTYDNVCKLMEAIRAGDVRTDDVMAGEVNPNIPVKDVSMKERLLQAEGANPVKGRSFTRLRSGVGQRLRPVPGPLIDPANGQLGLLPSASREVRRSLFPAKSPLFSTSNRKFQLQAPPAVAEKDVFDMQPFTPPPTTPTFASFTPPPNTPTFGFFTPTPTTPTLVRLPSPNEVFPLKSQSRRSPTKAKDQATLELRNDSSYSQPQQCGFEKTVVSLDLFDPLKNT